MTEFNTEWIPPALKAKAYEEFCRKYEKLPDPLPVPQYDPPMTYFNNPRTYSSVVVYDLIYHFEEGYDPKSKRDGKRTIHENIFKEESIKYVPVTTQMWYGHPLLLKNACDFGNRIPLVSARKDFYRAQGINISPDLEIQPEN